MKDPKVPGRSRAQLERDYRAFERRVAKLHRELFGAGRPALHVHPAKGGGWDLEGLAWVAVFLLLGASVFWK